MGMHVVLWTFAVQFFKESLFGRSHSVVVRAAVALVVSGVSQRMPLACMGHIEMWAVETDALVKLSVTGNG